MRLRTKQEDTGERCQIFSETLYELQYAMLNLPIPQCASGFMRLLACCFGFGSLQCFGDTDCCFSNEQLAISLFAFLAERATEMFFLAVGGDQNRAKVE